MRTKSPGGHSKAPAFLLGLVLGRGLPVPGAVRLVAMVVAAVLAATIVKGYLACLVALHVSLNLHTALWYSRAGEVVRRRKPFVVGLVAAAGSLMVMLLSSTMLHIALPGALVLATGVGAVTGWQCGKWHQVLSWSRWPGWLLLGARRTAPFFVRWPYAIAPADRLKHVSVQGPTGSGKTTLLKHLILTDIRTGCGVCVIDPKDDLIDRILPHIPQQRANDVIVFDAADVDRPLGFNPLSGVAPGRRSLAASELLAIFRRYFVDAWGARLEHVLRNVILALLEVPEATLLDVPRLLLDERFAQRALGHVTNPAVREFFVLEYAEILRRRGDVVEPILNKVGPWLTYPELRNIIGQPTSSFDLRRVMDRGMILLVRIPQGALGEDISSLLGALMVAKIQLAAHSRVDTPPERRRPFYLYVDEFQNFATSSFARILTEARAFGLGLVCANQYGEQLPRELQLAATHNVGTAVQCLHARGRYRLQVARLEETMDERPAIVLHAPAPLPPGEAVRANRIRALSRERYGGGPLEVQRDPVVSASGRRNGHGPRVRVGRGLDVDEE